MPHQAHKRKGSGRRIGNGHPEHGRSVRGVIGMKPEDVLARLLAIQHARSLHNALGPEHVMGSAVIGLEHQPAVMPVQQIGRRVATDTDSIGSPAARWGGFILPVPIKARATQAVDYG